VKPTQKAGRSVKPRFRVGPVLVAAVRAQQTTFAALAARMKVDPSNITRIVRDRPLSPELLRGVCRALESDVHRLAVVIAHLKDEALRAEADNGFTIVWPEGSPEHLLAVQAHAFVDQALEGVVITTGRKPRVTVIEMKPQTLEEMQKEIDRDAARVAERRLGQKTRSN
jgi:hypothetical protein